MRWFPKSLVTLPFAIDKRWYIGALILFFLYFFMGGGTGFIKIFTLKRQQNKLVKRIDDQKKCYTELSQLANDLTHDLATIEKIARSEYGMAAKDEIIIKVRREP
ncbi:hypothetical protein GF406_08145 [candidate division KSB1 bacterium]|jgi:cell division protein FtsB|nr:hypothetical protein [candidate division KSB1 bacterium]